MEIYLLGTKLFMIVETPLDFEWDEAFEKLAGMKRQRNGKYSYRFTSRRMTNKVQVKMAADGENFLFI